MNVDEVVFLLHAGQPLETAVKTLSRRLCEPVQRADFETPGLTYKFADDSIGFSVSVHGKTLLPKYTQVKASAAELSNLYGRLDLCFPDQDGFLAETVLTLIINADGHFSIDGSINFRYSPEPEKIEYSRHRLSLNIAAAVQAKMPTL